MHFRMFSSIPGIYSPFANSASPNVTAKNVFYQMSPAQHIHSGLSTTTLGACIQKWNCQVILMQVLSLKIFSLIMALGYIFFSTVASAVRDLGLDQPWVCSSRRQ